MNILLVFDYESRLLHIPDGYIEDIEKTHREFFPWLYRQARNMTDSGGYAYNAEDFLRYINSVILRDSNECAYFIQRGRIHKRLAF